MTTQQKIEQKEAELQELRNQLEKERNDPKKFLKEILGNELSMKVHPDKYPNSVFYFQGETCFLEIQESGETKYLWCNYHQVWNPISKKFSLDYASMQGLIKESVEEHFKMRDVTPARDHFSRRIWVEEHFKMRDVTPATKI